jgi:hypothetical protein
VLDAAGTPLRPQHADDVDADSSDALDGLADRPTLREPCSGEPPEPRELAVVHRLDRLAEAGAAPGLDLADDQTAAVAGHDVDLAEVAPPVAVEDLEAPVGEVAHGHPLAVAAQPARGAPRHARGDGSRRIHAPTVPLRMRRRTTPPTGCGSRDEPVTACGRPHIPLL